MVVMEEFKTSRNENLEAGKHAQLAFQICIAGYALLVPAIINAWKFPVVPELLLFIFIPIFSYMVALVWGGEIARRIRVAHFVRDVLEPKVNACFPDMSDALEWESYLRGKNTKHKVFHFKWHYYAYLTIIFGMPLASIIVGNVKIYDSQSATLLLLYDIPEGIVFFVIFILVFDLFRKFN